MGNISESLYTSRLPVELEREVFEIAAIAFPKSIPQIILVARRFRIWFEPELYGVIRSGEGRVVPPLYAEESSSAGTLILDIPRLKRYGHHVRNILLQKRSSQEIKDILQCCPNVSNLAMWIIHGTCAILVPILERLPLRRFSFDPSYFFENYAPDMSIPFDQPLFHNLTHLEIINASSSWSKWKQLAMLPQLSHLALAGMVNQQLIDRLIMECRSLEVFVMFYMNIGFLADEVIVLQKDPRVVLLRSVTDHLDHWERGARGEEDFWITAQKLKQEALEEAAASVDTFT